MIHKLAESKKVLGEGKTVEGPAKFFEVTPAIWPRWRNKNGEINSCDAKPVTDLEVENLRLKKVLSEAGLNTAIAMELAEGNFSSEMPTSSSSVARSEDPRLAIVESVEFWPTSVNSATEPTPADQVHHAVTIAATQKKHFFDRAVMPFFTEIDPGVINQSFEFEADAALASRDLNFVIVMFDYEDRVVLAMLCGGEVSMKFGDFGRGKIRIFAKRTAALLIAQSFQASVA